MVIKPKNGLHAEYYDNGQKQVEAHYKDDKLRINITSLTHQTKFRLSTALIAVVHYGILKFL